MKQILQPQQPQQQKPPTMKMPGTWNRASYQEMQDTTDESLHVHAKRGWLLVVPIFILVIGAVTATQFWFTGAHAERLQANLVVLSSTDKNDSIESGKKYKPFEIKYADWKLQSIKEIKTIHEYEDQDLLLTPESWSETSNQFIYFLKNTQGSTDTNQLQAVMYNAGSDSLAEVFDRDQLPNTKKITWLRDGQVMLNRAQPIIIDVNNPNTQDDMRNQQFKTDDAWDSWDVSPDGKKIIVVSGSGKIHLLNLDSDAPGSEQKTEIFVGKRTVKVTAADSAKFVDVPQLVQPAWSPDGKHIAFYKRLIESATTYTDARVEEVELVLMDAGELDIENPQAVATSFIVKGEKYSLLWSPDGRYLLDQNTGAIYDAQEKRLSMQGVYNTKQATFQWSKDNRILRRVVTTNASQKEKTSDIVLSTYDAQGLNQKELFRLTGSSTQQAINASAAQWINDGADTIFIADRRLWLIGNDGKNLRKLDVPEDDYEQVVVNKANKIIYTTENKIGEIVF